MDEDETRFHHAEEIAGLVKSIRPVLHKLADGGAGVPAALFLELFDQYDALLKTHNEMLARLVGLEKSLRLKVGKISRAEAVLEEIKKLVQDPGRALEVDQ